MLIMNIVLVWRDSTSFFTKSAIEAGKYVEIQVFDASIRLNFDILLLFPLIFLYHFVALEIFCPTLYRQIFLRFFVIVKKRLKAIGV